MLAFWSPKEGSWPQASMRRPWKLGTRNATLLALRDRMRCLAKKVLARIVPYTFISEYKDVDRFQKGSVHELYCLKVSQVSKVHAGNVHVR